MIAEYSRLRSDSTYAQSGRYILYIPKKITLPLTKHSGRAWRIYRDSVVAASWEIYQPGFDRRVSVPVFGAQYFNLNCIHGGDPCIFAACTPHHQRCSFPISFENAPCALPGLADQRPLTALLSVKEDFKNTAPTCRESSKMPAISSFTIQSLTGNLTA